MSPERQPNSPENVEFTPKQLEILQFFDENYGSRALEIVDTADQGAAEMSEFANDYDVDLSKHLNFYNFMAGMFIALTMSEYIQKKGYNPGEAAKGILTSLAGLRPKDLD